MAKWQSKAQRAEIEARRLEDMPYEDVSIGAGLTDEELNRYHELKRKMRAHLPSRKEITNRNELLKEK